MRGVCLLVLPLLLTQGLLPRTSSAAALKPHLHPEQMGPLAVLLLRHMQQHRDPTLLGLGLGDDALSDELLSDTLKESGEGDASQGLGQGQPRPAKRQVRYYQCYFNPISCFG